MPEIKDAIAILSRIRDLMLDLSESLAAAQHATAGIIEDLENAIASH